MKSASDPRHQLRRKIVQELYTYSYDAGLRQGYGQQAEEVIKNKTKIDKIIAGAAPEWPTDKINKVDLAILRLSIFEILEKKNPEKVTVDEAVELAKEFGSEASPAFINGVLGKVLGQTLGTRH